MAVQNSMPRVSTKDRFRRAAAIRHAKRTHGKNTTGEFWTTEKSTYPEGLCEEIAGLFTKAWRHRHAARGGNLAVPSFRRIGASGNGAAIQAVAEELEVAYKASGRKPEQALVLALSTDANGEPETTDETQSTAKH